MAVKPKLAMLPSGYKASKVYSVLPSNGVGDFDFTRSGSATRINKDGLIETVDSNVPRLNYPLIDGVVSGCPSLLLEPQSTNLITSSEDFRDSGWWSLDADITITHNSIVAPSGDMTGSTISYDLASRAVFKSALGLTGVYTFSIWLKGEGSNIGKTIAIDLDSNLYYPILTNQWVRHNYQVTNLAVLQITNRNSATIGTGEFYAWGAQLEQQSYATSYIPTNGSAVTRVAETCNGAGDANTFNDSEGVLMVEMSALNNTVSAYNSIGLGNGLVTNRIGLGFQPNDTIYAYKRGGSSAYWLPFKTVDITSLNKVALSYNTNDNHFWVNGFKIASNTTIGDASNLTELEFEASYGLEEFYGNTKQLQYFDTALNDTDLETLTSWTSFNEMATSQLYTIE